MSRGGGPILLLTHSYFDEDPRLRRQADALVGAGWQVDVIGLRRPHEPRSGFVGGARVRRLDVQRHQGAGVGTYLWEYLSFFLRASLRLARDHARRRYALVQVATLPDWLVFAALPLRLMGVPVVLDLHEAMPEFFASRFPRLARGPGRAMLVATERLSIGAASQAIAANEALRDRLVEHGIPPDHLTVVRNVPALGRFTVPRGERRPFMADGVLRLVYGGALTPTYDVGTVIDAVAAIAVQRPELTVTLDLYGRGDSMDALTHQAEARGLREAVRFHGRVPIESVPVALAAADVGVAPVAGSRFTRLSFSTKLLEYGAVGLPIVTARLPLAERLLGPDAVAFYEPEDAPGLAAAILQLVDDPAGRDHRVETMSARVQAMSWEVEQGRYLELIDEVMSRGRSGRRS